MEVIPEDPKRLKKLRTTLNISVLMGGPSAEHAISLKSGLGVAEALRARGWQVANLVIPQDLTVDAASQLARQALERSETDVVFIALHGPFGEDGTIQQLCEDLGLAYTGSDPAASAMGLDKVASRRRFESQGLRVPRWQSLEASRRPHIEQAAIAMGFPVVVKPTNQGSSLGVTITHGPGALGEAVTKAAAFDTRILLEAFVRGRELTVGIIEGQALPVVEIQPRHPFFDYTAKYTPGETRYVVPAELEEEIRRRVQQDALRAHQALGCRDVSRVDLILDEAGEPVILEVNTIPGFTATSLLPKAAACIDLSYDDLCDRLVGGACGRLPAARRAGRARASVVG